MEEKLNPIPVDFVVDFAQEFPTAKLREPYARLISRWALHEKRVSLGQELSERLRDSYMKKDSRKLMIYLFPAYRQEPKEKVIYRNYYMGSLVRLCDINRPLWERFLYVCLFTFVKAVKYGSILPFKHFRSLCRMLPDIKISRLRSK